LALSAWTIFTGPPSLEDGKVPLSHSAGTIPLPRAGVLVAAMPPVPALGSKYPPKVRPAGADNQC